VSTAIHISTLLYSKHTNTVVGLAEQSFPAKKQPEVRTISRSGLETR